MATVAKPAKEQWITKDEAARLLGVNPRQVQQRAAHGYIEKRVLPRLPTERQGRVEYSRVDVDALKAGKPNMHATQVDDVGPLAPSGEGTRDLALFHGAAPLRRSSGLGAPLEMIRGLAEIAAALQPPAPAAPKAWLTLGEAAAYSGLTPATIEELVRDRQVFAIGRGPKTWRIQRAGLYGLDAFGTSNKVTRGTRS